MSRVLSVHPIGCVRVFDAYAVTCVNDSWHGKAPNDEELAQALAELE